MERSTDRILTTHVGSLPRPPDLLAMVQADGNAFAVLIGNSSCAAGASMIEASLENAPYTTYMTDFTIQPPRPTFPE